MAISRQTENEEAATILLLQLAFENANVDCQKALFSERNEHAHLPAYIKACQNVGIEEHHASVLAAALPQASNTHKKTGPRCFNCQQEGYLQKNCPT